MTSFEVGDVVKIGCTVRKAPNRALNVEVETVDGHIFWAPASALEFVDRDCTVFEPGGILRYTDPVTHGTQDYVVISDNECVRLRDIGYRAGCGYVLPIITIRGSDPEAPTLTVERNPERFTYFPPGELTDGNPVH